MRRADCCANFRLREFWSGPDGTKTAARVRSFLLDFACCCVEIARTLRHGGHAVYVVGRRSVADTELRLDKFLEYAMCRNQCVVVSRHKRMIVGKMTPYSVCRRARCNTDKAASRLRSDTMREEYVIVFERVASRR